MTPVRGARVNAICAWVKHNPTRAMAVATVLLGWLALAHVPDTILAGVGTILGAVLAGPVHNAVTPVVSLVAATGDAAAQAATATAEALTEETVGVAGAVTETGAHVATMAAVDATHAVLTGLGIKRKARAKRPAEEG